MKFNSEIWNETVQRLTHNSNKGYMDMRELINDIQNIGDFQIDTTFEDSFAMGIEYQKTLQTKGA